MSRKQNNWYNATIRKKQPIRDENELVLERTYYNGATVGILSFPTGGEFYILERPWEDNQQNISCIPEGTYQMKKRRSGIVERTSGGEYQVGWEITDVPNRTYIMVHIGNYVDDTEGCLLPGMTHDRVDGVPVVWQSGTAFKKFMLMMEDYEQWKITIREKVT